MPETSMYQMMPFIKNIREARLIEIRSVVSGLGLWLTGKGQKGTFKGDGNIL